MPREAVLVQTFVELADTLVADFDAVDLLTTLAERCVEALDVAAAGVMLATDGNLRVTASSSEAMRVVELFELQNDEGPCLDSFNTARPVSAPDLIKKMRRWPRFAPHAVKEGFRAVHALPMRLRSNTIGALNLFTAEPGPLPAMDLRVAQALADVATIGILQERALRRSEVLTEQLQTALNSRVMIEQAKGLLAERAGISSSEAFTALRDHARHTGQLLSDIARNLVEGTMTIDLPTASADDRS